MADFFINHYDLWPWLGYFLAGFIQCNCAACAVRGRRVFCVGGARFRPHSGSLGPTRTGGKFGWLQLLADGLKLITKEDLMPAGAERLLFRLAPYVSFCFRYATLMALPFADGWVRST